MLNRYLIPASICLVSLASGAVASMSKQEAQTLKGVVISKEPSSALLPPATYRGELSSSDLMAPDESYYDDLVFPGTAGTRVRITLRSEDFDAYLLVGHGFGSESGDTFEAEERDDDGGGGTNARIEMTLTRTGPTTIRVNSLGANEKGHYTLEVARVSQQSGSSNQAASPPRYRRIPAPRFPAP